MLACTCVVHIRIIDIDPDLTRLHWIEKDNILSLVRNKLEDHFKEKFGREIGNSSRLTLNRSMNDDLKEKQYISDVKYLKCVLNIFSIYLKCIKKTEIQIQNKCTTLFVKDLIGNYQKKLHGFKCI